MTGFADLSAIVRQDWREDAACIDARMPDGSPAPFVDPDAVEVAEYLIRRWCHRCPVVGPCNEFGEQQRREAWHVVYGGRLLLGKRKGGRK